MKTITTLFAAAALISLSACATAGPNSLMLDAQNGLTQAGVGLQTIEVIVKRRRQVPHNKPL